MRGGQDHFQVLADAPLFRRDGRASWSGFVGDKAARSQARAASWSGVQSATPAIAGCNRRACSV
ncbi:hypothetical protein NXT3_PC01101 (plasmid) [Sinorhizobium fredii]|uniref:Uncharacterized protein n=1 Tax=Rhizobium fredii TaxID=380 RepID=A0A2L0HFR9_RHIFR|nr:hypothetical protein NXT3_PC01101 [Sinorhizobium fredii]